MSFSFAITIAIMAEVPVCRVQILEMENYYYYLLFQSKFSFQLLTLFNLALSEGVINTIFLFWWLLAGRSFLLAV